MSIGAQRGMISHLIKDVDIDETTKDNITNNILVEDEFDITKIIGSEDYREWLRRLKFVEPPVKWVVVTPSDEPINKAPLDVLKADDQGTYTVTLGKTKTPKDLHPIMSLEERKIYSARAKINAMNISASEKKRRIEQAIKQIKSSNKRR